MLSDRPDIYFLHIPKTAGTSLAQIIRRAYRKCDAIPVYGIGGLAGMSREQINGYRCYHGHFNTGLYSLLDRDVPTVTILRDPFERAVSNLMHAERERNRFGFNKRMAHRIWDLVPIPNVRRYLEVNALSFDLRDGQTRHLGVEMDATRYIGQTELTEHDYYQEQATRFNEPKDIEFALENAKRRLDSMAVVGTVERFEESLELICDFLGIPVPEAAPQVNVGEGHNAGNSYRTSGKLSPAMIKYIDRLNTHDRELYEYGSAILDRQLKAKSDRSNRDRQAPATP